MTSDGGAPLSLESVDGLLLDARLHRPRPSLAGGDGFGSVVLVHGIDANLDEGGMYRRLGDLLAQAGFGVVRFSFRGHGASGGVQRGVTIAGEMLDLDAAVGRARVEFAGPVTAVASSFGVVSTLETSRYLAPDRLVLWNPILDLRRTFIEPELPWGKENFGPQAWATAMREGALLVDGSFEFGRTMLSELSHYQPGEVFARSGMPALVIHGELDSYVSYHVARDAAQTRARHVPTDFYTVAGSDHGFDTREREDEAVAVTVAWITRELGEESRSPARPDRP